jgi:hypothetical protein
MRQIFQSEFNLGIKGEKPDLEEVISTTKDWVSRKFGGNLESFREGMVGEEYGSRLTSIAVDAEDSQNFAFTLIHPDREIKGVGWETVFSLSETEDVTKVGLTLSRGWMDGVLRPLPNVISKPFLIPQLIDQFSAHEEYELSTRPKIVTTNSMPETIEMIYNPDRKLPIVFISAEPFTDKPVANARNIAHKLAGTAYVQVTDSRFPSMRMERLIGKSMSCFNGAVRMYWPMGGNTGLRVFHPFSSAKHIREQGDSFAQSLLERIAQFSMGRSLETSYEDIRRLKLKQQIGETEFSEEVNQIVQMYADGERVAKEELGLLRGRLESQKMFYENRVANLESSLAEARGEANAGDKALPDFSTTREAVEHFKGMYSESELEFLPRAERGARDNSYQDPQQIFRALEWLATTYREARSEGGTDLEHSCLTLTGMNYKRGQSVTTMGQYADDYKVTWNKTTRELKEHMGHGSSKEAGETIRIAFFYDKETKKVVVGYIGQHQRTRAT